MYKYSVLAVTAHCNGRGRCRTLMPRSPDSLAPALQELHDPFGNAPIREPRGQRMTNSSPDPGSPDQTQELTLRDASQIQSSNNVVEQSLRHMSGPHAAAQTARDDLNNIPHQQHKVGTPHHFNDHTRSRESL